MNGKGERTERKKTIQSTINSINWIEYVCTCGTDDNRQEKIYVYRDYSVPRFYVCFAFAINSHISLSSFDWRTFWKCILFLFLWKCTLRPPSLCQLIDVHSHNWIIAILSFAPKQFDFQFALSMCCGPDAMKRPSMTFKWSQHLDDAFVSRSLSNAKHLCAVDARPASQPSAIAHYVFHATKSEMRFVIYASSAISLCKFMRFPRLEGARGDNTCSSHQTINIVRST